jgi:uncharacterized protein (TIGR02145 family)/uncharacterized repeat protein (TIGR02543 family)
MAAGVFALAGIMLSGCSDRNNGGGGGGGDEPASTYTITFDPNGGTGTPMRFTTNTDGIISSGWWSPTRDGYTFDGWFTEATGGEAVTGSTVFSHDATIYAHWTFNIRKVTFNANGGTVTPDSGTVFEGWKIDTLPTPTRDGYNFKGWFTADTGGTAVTKDSVVRSTTLYARWTFKTYTITLDYNDGSLTESRGNTTGDGWKLAPLFAPRRDGYTFAGWFTEATGGEAVTENTVFSNDARIYAQWKFTPYKITFNANGGTVTPDTGTTGDGWKLTSLPTPERDGYIFSGWFTAATGGTAVTEDSTFSKATTIYAQWTIKTYRITLDANGGSLNGTREGYSTKADGTLYSPNNWVLFTPGQNDYYPPTRVGYTFVDWYTAVTDGERVTSRTVFSKDTTIYAQWTLNMYSVSFNEQGGSYVSSQYIHHGGKLTNPGATTRTGYTFGGWYKEAAYATLWNFDTDTVTSDMTLYAKWNIIQYTITFDANDGTVTPTNATTGAGWRLASLPTPTKDGYTFNGWFTEETGGAKVTTGTAFSENTTIYAQWTITITFNANGGEVTSASGTTSDEWKLASLPTPTRNGYTFNGWFTAEASGEEVTTGTVFSANTTIYAQWTPITITFDANGGTVDPTTITIGDDWKLASLPTPTRDDYLFNGWFTAATGGTEVTISRVYSANATIYAQWIPAFTDVRDGKVYKKVKIGTQTWMAENLNYNIPNVTTDVCYENSASNCAKYGRLYDWSTAMGIDASYNSSSWSGSDVNHQGACPAGWHLPSADEWTILGNYAGGASATSTAGTNLKSSTGWVTGSGLTSVGTDSYGFSALSGGAYIYELSITGPAKGSFKESGEQGHWWSATGNNSSRASGMNLNWFSSGVSIYDSDRTSLFSVRCVQD